MQAEAERMPSRSHPPEEIHAIAIATVALRHALETHRMPFDWFEAPEGHNHTAWRGQLPRLLTTWYPPPRPGL